MLRKSISKIDKAYIWYDDTYHHWQPERCFAYELYHQSSNILERCKKILESRNYNCENNCYIDYRKLRINGEIFKDLSKRISPKSCPDLVLHGGDTVYNLQILACEIKRFNYCANKDLLYDIYKLIEYMELKCEGKDAQYQNVALILLGSNPTELKKRLNSLHFNRFSCNETKNKVKQYCKYIKRFLRNPAYKNRFYCVFIQPSSPLNSKGKIPLNEILCEPLKNIIYNASGFYSLINSI